MLPSQQDFINFRSPRRGKANPEVMTNPFWVWCVNSSDSAFVINEAFDGDSSFDVGPCWSFDRFGQTETLLPDGRVVYIAGEHEDSYDPDFYIYHDVIVVTPDDEVEIYGYPEDVFPATDFHSATVVGDEIILIGSLGYPDKRDPLQTQVMRLNTNDWSITRQETTNSPGWISRHTAFYCEESNVIRMTDPQQWTEENDLVDVFATWELDLTNWQWRCVEKKDWSQYRLFRKDGEMNNLFDLRTHVEMTSMGLDLYGDPEMLRGDLDDETFKLLQEGHNDMAKENEELINKTDLDLLPTLYSPSIPHSVAPEIDPIFSNFDDEFDDDYNQHTIEVDGIDVRFIEDSYDVTMRVEGSLTDDSVNTILDDVCRQLSKLESAEYTYKKIS
ncbi:MAG: hypothetical protein H7A51_15325 [Akkermansiaceae bacterium]|nr:hypothetical protein [Akkermansiaceae bacterium]